MMAEVIRSKPLMGIKTGLNEAFLIDTETKEKLVKDDPRCSELMRPLLRGQDLERWCANWAGLWMIACGHAQGVRAGGKTISRSVKVGPLHEPQHFLRIGTSQPLSFRHG